MYRGPLASCNYACWYCPFAKRHQGQLELANDEAALARFVDWVASRNEDRLSILFTPWGEALIRPWYQNALAKLSHLPQVAKVAAQTNLGCNLDWIERCDNKRLALWCSYHPGQVARDSFLTQCRRLDAPGVPYSVGMVGLIEHLAEAEALRGALRSDVYLWINAHKDEPDYYSSEDIQRFETVDPLFSFNIRDHPSKGCTCRAGESVIAVDGAGTVRRCHFVAEPLGNLYEPGFENVLKRRACTNDTCGCHIGYAHLPGLGLDSVFGNGLLERIPSSNSWTPVQRQIPPESRIAETVITDQVSTSGS